MIGIIGAMQEEIDVLLKQLTGEKLYTYGTRKFYAGYLKEKAVVIVKSGIGKVNAAHTTTLLMEHFDIDYLMNTGVAGGQDVKHNHVVVSSNVVYHDVDATAFSKNKYGQVPNMPESFFPDITLMNNAKVLLDELNIPYTQATIATGDQFVYHPSQIEKINQVYDDIKAIEMEAAAIAHIAEIYHKPFIIFRTISDVLGDKDQHLDFDKFLKKAANLSAEIITKYIEKFVWIA
ncbi:MAG: 5'-methylthioadenosine/adenosylhomocysteine nucleosidase [Candidatus Izimaplasma sp.]|nr:5'-methylthioadenosine/adenosylhomocysteine nucleosidase [Candidatus Izimaplasma bacterium]